MGCDSSKVSNQVTEPQKRNKMKELKIIQRDSQNIILKDIILNHPLPKNFHIGQIFKVRGILKQKAQVQGKNVYMTFQSINNSQKQYNYQARVQKDKKQFNINIYTYEIEQGDYILVLFSGKSGYYLNEPTFRFLKSDSLKFSYKDPSKICESPTNLRIDVINNKTKVFWQQKNKETIKKITFSQQKPEIIAIQYILTNFQSQFEIPYKDFQKFKQGQNVKISLCCAMTKNFNLISNFSQHIQIQCKAGKHHFDSQDQSLKLEQEIPWKIKKGAKINIHGSCKKQLKNSFPIQQPNFKIARYKLIQSTSQIINPNTLFKKTVTFVDEGAYILQINNIYGSAVLNRPVYVGDAIPFIPDYKDMEICCSKISSIIPEPKNLDQQRKFMLQLVNQKRKQRGVPPLKMTDQLNLLAQGHSIDMVKRDFYGHQNPDKQGPSERAKRMKLNYSVGENVASNKLILGAHLGLCRSPGHLQNIVNEDYQKIGFGIEKDKQDNYYVTQNFACRDFNSNPLSDKQLKELRIQVITWIIAHSSNKISESQQLSQLLNRRLNQNSDKNVIDYIKSVPKYSCCGMHSKSLKISWSKNLIKNFQNDYLKPTTPSYSKFGLSIKQLYDQLQFEVIFIR